MRHILKSGKVAEVYFNHEYAEVPLQKEVPAHTKWAIDKESGQPYSFLDQDCPVEIKPYKTTLKVTVDGNVLEADATCHPNDTFSKKEGRRTTWTKLTKGDGIKLHDVLNKEERRELFYKVFPRFNPEPAEVHPCVAKAVHEDSDEHLPSWAKDLLNGISNLKNIMKKKIKG